MSGIYFSTIKTDNNIYKLLFNFNTICAIESIKEQSIMKYLKELEGNPEEMALSDIRLFLKIALEQGENRTFTYQEVGEIISGCDLEFEQIYELIYKGLQKSFKTNSNVGLKDNGTKKK